MLHLKTHVMDVMRPRMTTAAVTVTVIAVVCSKCNSDDSSSNLAETIRINS